MVLEDLDEGPVKLMVDMHFVLFIRMCRKGPQEGIWGGDGVQDSMLWYL